GYTLEPSGAIMRKLGVATTIEAGLIAKYILGDEKADGFAAGCAMTTDFINNRPEVAKRFAAAWAKALEFINKNPEEARKYLAKNTLTPDDLVDSIPMIGYFMAKDLTTKQYQDLQKFVDFGTEIGVVPEKLDAKKFIKVF